MTWIARFLEVWPLHHCISCGDLHHTPRNTVCRHCLRTFWSVARACGYTVTQ